MQKSLQTRIMKKFMNEGQIRRFLGQYNSASGGKGEFRCRTYNLEATITEDDLEFLKYYTENSEMTLKEMATELKLGETSLTHKAGAIAVKWVFQNSDKVFEN